MTKSESWGESRSTYTACSIIIFRNYLTPPCATLSKQKHPVFHVLQFVTKRDQVRTVSKATKKEMRLNSELLNPTYLRTGPQLTDP